MRVYQCDRCGAIIGKDEEMIKLQFENYSGDARVVDAYEMRDLCKKCADRLLREASGEPVEPSPRTGMVDAERLKLRIRAHAKTVAVFKGDDNTILGGKHYTLDQPGMALDDIIHHIDMEACAEEMKRVGLERPSGKTVADNPDYPGEENDDE